MWSGSLYSDKVYGKLYNEAFNVSQPTLAVKAEYEHIKHDLTKSYVNAFSGNWVTNPHVKVAAANGMIRELVHFHPTYGAFGSTGDL